MLRISSRHVPAYVATVLLTLAAGAQASTGTALAATPEAGEITVSDTAAGGAAAARSGPALAEPTVGCAFSVALTGFAVSARTATFTFAEHGGVDDGTAVPIAPDSPTPATVTLAVPPSATPASATSADADRPDQRFAFRLDTSTLSAPPTGAPLHLQVSVAVRTAVPGAPATTTSAPFALTCPATAPVTDLAVTAADTADPVPTATPTRYRLTVRNVGTATVPVGAATVTDTVSSLLAVTGATGPDFGCDVTGHQVSCTNTAVLHPTSTSDITLTASAGGIAGIATNTATVAVAADATAANNTAVITTTVTVAAAAPDHVAAPAATPAASFSDSCAAGPTLALTNTGTAPATFTITAPDATTEQLTVPPDTTTAVTKSFVLTVTQRVVTVAAPSLGPVSHTFGPTCAPDNAVAPGSVGAPMKTGTPATTPDTTAPDTTTPDRTAADATTKPETAGVQPAPPAAAETAPAALAAAAPVSPPQISRAPALLRLDALAVSERSTSQSATTAPVLAPSLAPVAAAPAMQSMASLSAGLLSVSGAPPVLAGPQVAPLVAAPTGTTPATAVRSDRPPALVGRATPQAHDSTVPFGTAAAGGLGLLLGAGLVLRRRAAAALKR